MDKSIRQKLEEPFDKKHILTRKSGRGQSLQYLEGAQYIQRFNDCTEGEWSYTIVDRMVVQRPDARSGKPVYDLVVVVEVRAFGQVRQAFGGSVTPSAECLGDDWKAALTDALKKAIASFGVALDLYTKGELAREDDDVQVNENVTRSQLHELTSAMRAAGWDVGKIDAMSLEMFGKTPRDLLARQATELIRRVEAAAGERR